MKLAGWAPISGVHPQTAYRWFRRGTMPIPARRLPSGTILVDAPDALSGGRTVLYARVSAHDQRADLDRQVARLTAWAPRQDVAMAEMVTEVGSGLNGKRSKFKRLPADPQVTVITMEHRDWLTRSGVEHLEAALSAQGRGLAVVDPGEPGDDLVRDMIDVLTSLRVAAWSSRRRIRAMRAVTCAKRPSDAARGTGA